MHTKRWLMAVSAGLTCLCAAACTTALDGTAAPADGLAGVLSSATGSSAKGSSATGSSAPESTELSGSAPLPSLPSSGLTSTSTPTSTPTSTSGEDQSTPASSGSAGGTGTAAPTSGTGQAYPTGPVPYPATPTSTESANLLEARRLAGYLLVPTVLEPTFTVGGGLSTLPLKSASAISLILSDPVPAVAQRAGMITGFTTERSTPDDKSSLLVAALEFADARSAASGAVQLAAAARDKATDAGPAVIPGYPKAVGWLGKSSTGPYEHVFLAQGRLVLYAWSEQASGTSAIFQNRLRRTLTAESRALAAFVPVAPADLMKQAVDPDGLRAHTIPEPPKSGSVVDGLYSAAGMLHYAIDPIGAAKVLAAAGVDRFSVSRTFVYRARDEAAAATVRDSFHSALVKDPAWKPDAATSAVVPGARCVQQPLESQYHCWATRGRFAFEMYADSAAEVSALLSAQYELLAGLS